jgi:hypothetical protein
MVFLFFFSKWEEIFQTGQEATGGNLPPFRMGPKTSKPIAAGKSRIILTSHNTRYVNYLGVDRLLADMRPWQPVAGWQSWAGRFAAIAPG